MSFDSWSEFFAMGGHGLYVWLAYGAAVIVVFLNVVGVRVARDRFFRQARALERRTRELK
ncbi:MAG: heme exporter protein CcmD [Gammaproteobacteria bacterium]|jgi:heme exporter protein D|nr:MAG: heme exporter protein CcmD [Gammaproteobacteria bacterium]